MRQLEGKATELKQLVIWELQSSGLEIGHWALPYSLGSAMVRDGRLAGVSAQAERHLEWIGAAAVGVALERYERDAERLGADIQDVETQWTSNPCVYTPLL